ncbi:MAG: hypothetical protein M1835_007978 [Candelina submexicana]|nr:MAG: hypothetical protein M1835_007978 [Candelina submexicana]
MLLKCLGTVIPIVVVTFPFVTPIALGSRDNGTVSLTERSTGPICDNTGLLGDLMYYDCALTITRMYTTTDSQTVNYHGERQFFPPLVDCAIAVFPFPSFFDQSDTSTWEDLRRSASAIAKQCQKGKSVGVGGYELGLGQKRNTAIIIFRLPRPSGVDYSAVASLSDAAWHKLFIFFQAHHDNELMGLGSDEPGSSSQAEMPTLTLSDIEANWGTPPATLPINPSIIESWNPDIEFWLYPPDQMIASVPDQTCGVGYCLPDQGCSELKGEAKGGCQCFRFSARIAMNIIFGVGRFLAGIGRCLGARGPDGSNVRRSVLGSGPSVETYPGG